MTKVPSLDYEKVIKALQRDGWVVVRQKGSHIRLQKNLRDEVLKITVPAHRPIKRSTLQGSPVGSPCVSTPMDFLNVSISLLWMADLSNFFSTIRLFTPWTSLWMSGGTSLLCLASSAYKTISLASWSMPFCMPSSTYSFAHPCIISTPFPGKMFSMASITSAFVITLSITARYLN